MEDERRNTTKKNRIEDCATSCRAERVNKGTTSSAQQVGDSFGCVIDECDYRQLTALKD
jgi:hypothetical protein